ncbi:cytochrome P450 81E8 [Morus notabilis]|uniref:cytochrome P450 81E8 n=1 Tax=Morus notabilis TaxID=981085 RepID=UPI000CED45AE|nr:cytochrome P450 81E8 [Morus notabilis]
MFLYFLYFLLCIVLYLFTNHFLNKIRNLPPSPFPALPIIGHLYLFKKPLYRTLSKISNRYGPVLLLQFGARPVLIVTSPTAAEECLTANDVVFANRPRLLAGKHLGYNFTSLSWAPYGDHWRSLRRISSLEILSSHRLQMLSHIRADEVRSLVRRLLRSRPDQTVEMKSLLFELTLNVMMRMIAGKRYYGESLAEVEEARRFREIVRKTFSLGATTSVSDFVPLMRCFGGKEYEKSLIELQRDRDGFMQNLIEEHRKRATSNCGSCSLQEDKNKTMIEVLLSLQESEPEFYKDEIIRGLMAVLLAAGIDTSSGTMEWAMSLLLNHPEVLKKAHIELENCVGNERLVEESDLKNLPYLHCILKETLRLYPAGTLLVPHESSDECKVSGFNIPRGTMLFVNLWAMQRDPKLWDDPTTFKPERFKDMEEGMRDGYKLMPFGSGRRGCPGENLAVRIVELTLGLLIQCFEWERVGKELVDMTEGPGLTMPKAHPLQAKCRPRPTMANILSQI